MYPYPLQTYIVKLFFDYKFKIFKFFSNIYLKLFHLISLKFSIKEIAHMSTRRNADLVRGRGVCLFFILHLKAYQVWKICTVKKLDFFFKCRDNHIERFLSTG